MEMERYLQKLGLEPKEIKVYLACLKNTKNSPASLTRQTGLKRSTIYFYLEKLIKKGLIESRINKKRKYFVAIPAQSAFDLFFEQKEEAISEKKKIFHKLLPKLIEATKDQETSTKINFLEGRAGMHYIIKKILAEKKDLYWYGSNDAVISMLGGEESLYKRLTLERLKQDTTAYAITDRSVLKNKRFSEELGSFRKFRFLDSDFDINGILIIFGNHVCIASQSEENIKAVLIEDSLTTSIILSMFQNLWQRIPEGKIREFI